MLRIQSLLILVVALLCLSRFSVNAQTYIIYSEDAGRQAFEVDSIFYMRSLPIVFPVSKAVVDTKNPELEHFIQYAIPLLHGDTSRHARIRVRSGASPEGLRPFNKRLSKGRRDELLRIFREHNVRASELQVDVVDEDYELLAFLMRQAQDPDAALVSRLVADNRKRPLHLKSLLQGHNRGKLWRRMYREYFPQLRASRFVIIFPESSQEDVFPADTVTATPVIETPVLTDTIVTEPLAQEPEPEVTLRETPVRVPRREMLAIKTNLLEWGAYVPQYGWCPMPNVELEYYPKHGHWTLGATFDFPWWKGSADSHKYFRLNNLQLYTRYYFRNSNKSYTDGVSVPDMKAAFKGFYVQAYAQAFLYQIGFNEDKGWIGEGFGGGLGLGYAMPLTKSGRWRLDFNVQVGVFATKYDPYVYGCPVENVKDGLYYYDYVGDANLFSKREYSLNWIGPTRVGVSISYDLFYRRNNRKGVSFRKYE